MRVPTIGYPEANLVSVREHKLGSAKSFMDLSIILVSHNCSKFLLNCLTSIRRTVSDIKYEVICVDNHSLDDTVYLVSNQFPYVRLIVNEENLGFAAANNQAIDLAQGEFVLFLNPDTVVQKNSVKQSVGYLRNNPTVGVVGAKLLNEDGSVQAYRPYFPSILAYLLESLYLDKVFLKGTTHLLMAHVALRKAITVDFVKGAFMMTRNKILQETGGFDLRFFMYTEEMDLCYRIKERGLEVVVLPSCEVIHFGGQSAKPMQNQMFVELHRSKIKYHRKHQGMSFAMVASALLFIGVIGRLVLWGGIAAFSYIQKGRESKEIKAKAKNYLAACKWYLKGGFLAALSKGHT